jgi:hypothetical protein
MTTKTPLPSGDQIAKIRGALPSGSFSRITEITDLDYQLVHRTLHGRIKRWDSRHDTVLATAKKILADVGYSL